MYYQHDGAPPHCSQIIRQYPNHKVPNWWIGRGDAHNWPSQSLGMNPLDYYVWGYVKAMVYAHKVNTREELLQWILCTVKNFDNVVVLHTVTSSLVTHVRKCIQADGGHWTTCCVLNVKSETVHLTKYLLKCTMLIFFVSF